WKGEDGKWIVALSWRAGRSDNRAHWTFQPGAHGGTVTAIDEHASDLIEGLPARPLRTVGPVIDIARPEDPTPAPAPGPEEELRAVASDPVRGARIEPPAGDARTVDRSPPRTAPEPRRPVPPAQRQPSPPRTEPARPETTRPERSRPAAAEPEPRPRPAQDAPTPAAAEPAGRAGPARAAHRAPARSGEGARRERRTGGGGPRRGTRCSGTAGVPARRDPIRCTQAHEEGQAGDAVLGRGPARGARAALTRRP